MGYLDAELEKAIEQDPDMELGSTLELYTENTNYLIRLIYNGKNYSIDDNREVQYNGHKVIIRGNKNISVNELLRLIKSHAKTQ